MSNNLGLKAAKILEQSSIEVIALDEDSTVVKAVLPNTYVILETATGGTKDSRRNSCFEKILNKIKAFEEYALLNKDVLGR